MYYYSLFTINLSHYSPAIVDHTCDFDVVGQRMAWGKFVNAGQVCIHIGYMFLCFWRLMFGWQSPVPIKTFIVSVTS